MPTLRRSARGTARPPRRRARCGAPRYYPEPAREGPPGEGNTCTGGREEFDRLTEMGMKLLGVLGPLSGYSPASPHFQLTRIGPTTPKRIGPRWLRVDQTEARRRNDLRSSCEQSTDRRERGLRQLQRHAG